MTTRFGLSSERAGGTDRRWPGMWCDIVAVKVDHVWPGGPATMTCQLVTDPGWDDRSIDPGRILRLWRGASNVWTGELAQPDTSGDAITLTAAGLAQMADRYVATADSNALSVAANVDAAISRGLPWVRTMSAPVTAVGALPAGKTTLKAGLDGYTEQTGYGWTVDALGRLGWAQPTTAVSRLLSAGGQGGARTVDAFATDIYGAYTAVTGSDAPVLVRGPASNTVGRTAYGRHETTVDLTGQGAFTTGQVDAVLATAIARYGYRVRWTAAFAATDGTLTNVGGAPVDLACEAAGRRVRVLVADVTVGETVPAPVEFVVGATSFDEDAGTLALTPIDTQRKDLVALLGTLPKGRQ